MNFGPNDSKVVLWPRRGYVPEVLSTYKSFHSLISPPLRASRRHTNFAQFGPLWCISCALVSSGSQSSCCVLQRLLEGAASHETETIPLDSGHNSTSLEVLGLAVPYWGEGPLHQRNGLLLGLDYRSVHHRLLCGSRLVLSIHLCQVL